MYGKGYPRSNGKEYFPSLHVSTLSHDFKDNNRSKYWFSCFQAKNDYFSSEKREDEYQQRKKKLDSILPLLDTLCDKHKLRVPSNSVSHHSRKLSEKLSSKFQDKQTKQTSDSKFDQSGPTIPSKQALNDTSAFIKAIDTSNKSRFKSINLVKKIIPSLEVYHEQFDGSRLPSSLCSPEDTLRLDGVAGISYTLDNSSMLPNTLGAGKEGDFSPKRKVSENIEAKPFQLPYIMSADSLPQKDSPNVMRLPIKEAKSPRKSEGSKIHHLEVVYNSANLSGSYIAEALLERFKLEGEKPSLSEFKVSEEAVKKPKLTFMQSQEGSSLQKNQKSDDRGFIQKIKGSKASESKKASGGFSLLIESVNNRDSDCLNSPTNNDNNSADIQNEEDDHSKSVNDDAPAIRRVGAKTNASIGFGAMVEEIKETVKHKAMPFPTENFIVSPNTAQINFNPSLFDSPEKGKAASADIFKTQIEIKRRGPDGKANLFSNYLNRKFDPSKLSKNEGSEENSENAYYSSEEDFEGENSVEDEGMFNLS